MKDEYNFSGAARGKFYRPDAQMIPPVRLDPEVLACSPTAPRRAASRSAGSSTISSRRK